MLVLVYNRVDDILEPFEAGEEHGPAEKKVHGGNHRQDTEIADTLRCVCQRVHLFDHCSLKFGFSFL